MTFYLILSKLNGFALDVEGANQNPGTKIFLWPKHGKDNQQWRDDPATGTIRSKINDFCLDFENNQLVTRPYQPGDPNQQWERRGDHIVNRTNQNEVLDVAGSDKNQGARVCKYSNNGGENQKWNFEYVGGQPQAQGYPGFQASTYPSYPGGQSGYPGGQPGYPGGQPGYPGGQQPYPGSQQPYPGGQQGYPGSQPQREEFFITSEMNGKVIDIKGGNKEAGGEIIMWSKNAERPKNQRWYLDQQGYIRSALNDMVFTANNGHHLKMAPYSGDAHSLWRFDGNRLVNQAGDAMDISRGNSGDGAEVIAYKPNGKENQRWKKEH